MTPEIHLNENENRGTAECGCVLDRDYEGSGSPAFIFCHVHNITIFILNGNSWEGHPDYPINDWRYEVANEDTTLGYKDWVQHKAEINWYEQGNDLTNPDIGDPT